MKQSLPTDEATANLCFEASKLLPYQPDWTWLREICQSLTTDGNLPSAEALADAYRNRKRAT